MDKNRSRWAPISGKIIALIVAALIITPVMFNQYLPLNDYPFHLARMIILADIENPVYSEFYKSGSFLLPNIAMSIVALPLSNIVGAEYASKLFVALGLLAMLFGTMMLHSAAHKRFSPWPLLSVVLLFNGIFYYGFLNYIFGMGVALLFSGILIKMQASYSKHLLTLVMSLILILLHFSAFGIFAIIVGSTELFRATIRWRDLGLKSVFLSLIVAALPFLIAISIFSILSPTAEVSLGSIKFSSLGMKFSNIIYSILTGNTWLDICFWSFVIIGFSVAIYNRCLIISPFLMLALFMLTIAYIILPSAIMEVYFVDSRLGPAIALLGLTVFDVKNKKINSDLVIASFALVLAVVTIISINRQWAEYNTKTSNIVGAFENIESGATVFAATTQRSTRLTKDTPEKRVAWQPPLKHVASYAILSGPKFVPMTFAHPTMQPLNVTEKYRDIKAFQSDNPRETLSSEEFESFLFEIKNQMESGLWSKLDNVYLFVFGFDSIKDDVNLPKFKEWVRVSETSDNYVLLKIIPKG